MRLTIVLPFALFPLTLGLQCPCPAGFECIGGYCECAPKFDVIEWDTDGHPLVCLPLPDYVEEFLIPGQGWANQWEPKLHVYGQSADAPPPAQPQVHKDFVLLNSEPGLPKSETKRTESFSPRSRLEAIPTDSAPPADAAATLSDCALAAGRPEGAETKVTERVKKAKLRGGSQPKIEPRLSQSIRSTEQDGMQQSQIKIDLTNQGFPNDSLDVTSPTEYVNAGLPSDRRRIEEAEMLLFTSKDRAILQRASEDLIFDLYTTVEENPAPDNAAVDIIEETLVTVLPRGRDSDIAKYRIQSYSSHEKSSKPRQYKDGNRVWGIEGDKFAFTF
eukprot:GHVO01027556.1.p1 GENE.GHVO01027556.1~~GHVO01027556.1.p1  ORF type:complete len:331 (+),score=36.66 GHVO01027556.1:617-1609(+)